jgi:hypothetical protein
VKGLAAAFFCLAGDRRIQFSKAADVCVYRELKARRCGAGAQRYHVYRLQLREKVVERRETKAEMPVHQSCKRAMAKR